MYNCLLSKYKTDFAVCCPSLMVGLYSVPIGRESANLSPEYKHTILYLLPVVKGDKRGNNYSLYTETGNNIEVEI